MDPLPEEETFKTIDRLTGQDKKQFKINNRCKREIFYSKLAEGKRKIIQCWELDKEVRLMTEPFKPEFYTEWNIGIQSYISGDWGKAKTQFKKTLNFIQGYEDSPSKFLINFIETNEGTAVQKNWPLYREYNG